MNTEVTLPPSRALPVSATENAQAATAHARINIALNLEAWRALPEDIQGALLWFHQHALDARLSWEECAEALDYDQSNIYRILKGTYEGNWGNVAKSIASYRKLVAARGQIQQSEFRETTASRLIFGGLDYAIANKSITVIIGESRQGKSVAACEWQRINNHGRAVYVIAPAYGGTKALLTEIAAAVGVNKNLDSVAKHQAVLRAFNRNRILIVDEAHRLMPGDRRGNPVSLEILRDIHDRTGAALALLATARFETDLKRGEYMFEQLVGRVGMPIRLPRKTTAADILPIVRQYIVRPGTQCLETLLAISNAPGRLGILVETLKVAARIAQKKSETCGDPHVFAAIKIRKEMQGETLYSQSPS